MHIRFAGIMFSVLFAIITTGAHGSPYAGKKLIHYGVCSPSTADLRLRCAEYERVPLNGIVIKVMEHGMVDQGQGSLGWKVFSTERFRPEQYETAIEDLRAAGFRRFTDNFIQVIAMPGNVDWFDENWSAVAHNAACLARVAKLGGCKGIAFDPEDYGDYHIWRYKRMPAQWQTRHTFEEYSAKVRERGRELIRAVNAEYPDITFLCFFGPSYTYLQTKTKLPEDAEYGLMAAFYDGMCEAATDGTTFVDGYELSYGFRTPDKFAEGRKFIFEAERISYNKQAFRKHIRAGFGVWLDNMSRQVGWHDDDFALNYFTPNGLRATLAYAMEASDEYVWLYSEVPNIFGGATMPQAYLDAIAEARTGPGPGEKNPFKPRLLPVRAAEINGYSDEKTFEEMRQTMTEVFDFPKDNWRFKRDRARVGVKQGWYLPGRDTSEWREILIGRFWEEEGEDYDGCAWYRHTFTAPAADAGKRVFLAVGAADEMAKIWLNGRFIAERNVGPEGWDQPFAVEVTHTLKSGEQNILAVQVIDTSGAGGLWKSVKLMVK